MKTIAEQEAAAQVGVGVAHFRRLSQELRITPALSWEAGRDRKDGKPGRVYTLDQVERIRELRSGKREARALSGAEARWGSEDRAKVSSTRKSATRKARR